MQHAVPHSLHVVPLISLSADINDPGYSAHTKSSFVCSYTGSRLRFSAPIPGFHSQFFRPSCQNATALAAATFRESTPCDIGIFTV